MLSEPNTVYSALVVVSCLLSVVCIVQPDKLAESFQYFLQGLGLGKSFCDNG